MRSRRATAAAAIGLAALWLAACQPSTPDEPAAAPESPQPDAAPAGGIVEVTVQDFAFVAPPTLPSGWNTLRMTNAGEQPHFLMMYRLPEGVTFDQYAQMSAVFQEEYDRYYSGEVTVDELLAAIGGRLPEWFPQLVGAGGVALTSPGQTSETTLALQPGEYVMECYVLTPEGRFHGSEGMLRPLIVTEESSGGTAPEADVRITVSNYAYQVEGDLTAGEHVIQVDVVDQAEGIVLHDVNLARLAPETSLDAVGAWMNFIDALRAPEPATFLGGVDHMSGGTTGYFRVNLEPGRYAFVSEGFAARGMVHEFTVE